MGLFGRTRRPSTTRIAEGGSGSELPASNSAPLSKKKTNDDSLDLFGADSDESDDDATIDRYANGAAPDDVDALDEQQALDAESKKVSTLLSKVRTSRGTRSLLRSCS